MKRLNKRGIIEMMETFMILFIIFILIGFAMFFFFKTSTSSAKASHTEICLSQGNELLSSIVKMPQLECSGTDNSGACIDTAKVVAYIELTKAGNKDLKKLLESGACPKKVVIEQAYPAPERGMNRTNCTKSEMMGDKFPANCGKWVVYEPIPPKKTLWVGQRSLSVPVSLYYPTKNEYGIGRMVVTIYTTT